MSGYGNQNENRIGAITSRVRVPGDAAAMYARNISSVSKPTADEIALTKQVAATDPYMARGNIFAGGTAGLNGWSMGTGFLGKQYDEDGNLHRLMSICVA